MGCGGVVAVLTLDLTTRDDCMGSRWGLQGHAQGHRLALLTTTRTFRLVTDHDDPWWLPPLQHFLQDVFEVVHDCEDAIEVPHRLNRVASASPSTSLSLATTSLSLASSRRFRRPKAVHKLHDVNEAYAHAATVGVQS